MHILASYADSPELQANYTVAWKLTPYLGMDLIIPRMVRFMNIYMAGRVFLYVCLLQFVLGTVAVHAALFRRFSPWPFASALFAYSFVFSLGFVNYLFGVGVWLFAVAGWICLSPRAPIWRILGGGVLSLAVFFCHYFAFLGYMLFVGSYELGVWVLSPKAVSPDTGVAWRACILSVYSASGYLLRCEPRAKRRHHFLWISSGKTHRSDFSGSVSWRAFRPYHSLLFAGGNRWGLRAEQAANHRVDAYSVGDPGNSGTCGSAYSFRCLGESITGCRLYLYSC